MGSSGKGAARTLLPGRIVLQAEARPDGLRDTDDAIAEALGVRLSTTTWRVIAYEGERGI
jgi:hypothetical protein